MGKQHEAVKFVIELLALRNATSRFILETVELIARDKRVRPNEIKAFKQKLLDGDVNLGPEVERHYGVFKRESVYVHSAIWKEEPGTTERGLRITRLRRILEQMLRAMYQ